MSFISKAGRHNVRSIGKDLGFDKFNKIAKNNLDANSHSQLHDIISGTMDTLTDTGFKIGNGIGVKLIESAIDKLINCENETSTLSMSNITSALGSNTAKYYTTAAHVGMPTTDRLKKQQNVPFVQYNEKDLASTNKDYKEHKKRKQLTITSGFSEKGYAFFMEDTFLTTEELLTFFRSNKKIEPSLQKSSGRNDVYGGIYKKINEFKFTNNLEYHNLILKLHLVKITDLHDDVRNLIEEFTNNSTKKIPIKNKNKDQEEINLRGSSVKEKVKTMLKEVVKKNLTNYRGSDFGRLPEDQQYSDPILNDSSNKFCINFTCSLDTLLNDSIQFSDRAKIVHTWNRILTPDSIWDFKLTHHFGNGVYLNYLFDIENVNKNHPVGYIFVLEYFGDRRAKITRSADEDIFTGYSPCRILCDFKHKLGYLGKDSDENLTSDDIPIIYRYKRNESDFDEKSDFAKLFCPDRDSEFHVPYEDIQFLTSKKSKDGKVRPFILNYDQTVLPSNNVLEKLQANFEKHNLDSSNLVEEDSKFNITIPPSERNLDEDETLNFDE